MVVSIWYLVDSAIKRKIGYHGNMKLLEYEAKRILKEAGIPVPGGQLVTPGGALPSLPCVLKVQVPVGGRGKAGGIVVVNSEAEYSQALSKLQHITIAGHSPSGIYAEELIDIEREIYLSLVINYQHAGIELVAHGAGGVEVEENSQGSFLRIGIRGSEIGNKEMVDGSWNIVDGESNDSKWRKGGTGWDEVGQQLADYLDLPEQTFLLQDMVENLYGCFTSNDATLLEINPLVVTKNGKLVAADCKLELDDAAAFRHPNWAQDYQTKTTSANFVDLNQDGNVATIANGAGLAMATVDAIADAGFTPANFLDIGGGASEASVLAAFERLTNYKAVKAIVINIFAGITRCDEVAKAIIAAQSQISALPPLYIRLSGTNVEAAEQLLTEAGVGLYSSLENCLAAINSQEAK